MYRSVIVHVMENSSPYRKIRVAVARIINRPLQMQSANAQYGLSFAHIPWIYRGLVVVRQREQWLSDNKRY